MSDLDSLRIDPSAKESRSRDRSVRIRLLSLISLTVALVLLAVASIFVGSGHLSPSDVWQSLIHGGDSTTATIVRDYRVPRTLLAIMAGASLAAAGAVIQALTRNPLADPGILGVNAGAYFAVVVGAAWFSATTATQTAVWGLAGAALASVLVYLIGSSGRAGGTPARMVLAGVALGSMLIGLSYGITLLLPSVFDKIRFWQVGSLQGRQMESVTGVLVFVIIGLVLALALSPSLNAMALGDDLATALGAKIVRTRAGSFVAVALLCGASTAVVGPIAFVGLMVPHIARACVGADQRWILATCLVLGPVLFLVSDMIGRVVVSNELPVGIVTAFIGAPLLIWLVRRGKAAPQ